MGICCCLQGRSATENDKYLRHQRKMDDLINNDSEEIKFWKENEVY